MVSGATIGKNVAVFGILFFAFAVNAFAGCLYEFAPAIVEPEKAMAATYAVIGPLI